MLKLNIVVSCLNYDDYLQITLPRNLRQHNDITVVTGIQDTKTHAVCAQNNALCCVSSRINQMGAPFAKGKAINDALDLLEPKEWVLVMDADILLTHNLIHNLSTADLDPEKLYYTRRWGPENEWAIEAMLRDFDCAIDTKVLFERHACKEVSTLYKRQRNGIECRPFGYFQLFHVKANALRGRKRIYEEKFGTAEMDDCNFGQVIYSTDKRKELCSPIFDVIHIPHGEHMRNWSGRVSPRIDQEEMANASQEKQ